MSYNKAVLLQEIEEEEGFRASAYQDHLGYWTIGIGTLIDARKGGGISKEAAYFMVGEKIASIEAGFDEFIPWWRTLNDVRQRVLISMAYQMGVSGLLKFKNTLRKIKTGDYAGAKAGMLNSLWARQTPTRAHRLANRMETGVV
ncbi:glycoside hydrolase family protein [Porticoccus sp.]